MPNASAKRHAIRLRKQGSEGLRPVSFDTDVIAHVVDPARHDPLERLKVVVHVHGEPVGRYAA